MRVLIVDDTPLILDHMRAVLRGMGDIAAEGHLDPRAALRACREAEPDLVFVDYLMPEMDGVEFIRQLRLSSPAEALPVVMLTSAAERDVRCAAFEAGATDFLLKPVDHLEFQARVRNMLGLRRAHLTREAQAAALEAAVDAALERAREHEREAIVRLSRASEFRDPETGAHIVRMSHYSVLVAQELGWTEAQCELLLHAAPMHDVGKVGTPDAILLKPGKLTPEELAVMREHAQMGYDILQGSRSEMLQMAAEIALTHHEKFDGSGYPRGLSGADIPEVGRIVAVADVFDALTSERPYKPAWDVERARDLLLDGRGSHFDPRCVDALLRQWSQVLAVRDRHQD